MIIRRIEKEDIGYASKLRNTYIDYIRQPFPQNLKDQLDWFYSTKNIYWVVEKTISDMKIGDIEKLTGIFGLTDIDLINRKCELSLITKCYLDEEIANFALDYVERFCFEKLNMNKIFITYFDFDEKKKKYFENRYEYQYTIKENVFYKNKFWDEHCVCLYQNNYIKGYKCRHIGLV